MGLEQTLVRRVSALEDELYAAQEENRLLKTLLSARAPDSNSKPLHLTPHQQRIFAALASGAWVHLDALASTTQAAGDSVVRTQIAYMRKRLKPHGLTIVSDWNGSYRMTGQNEAHAVLTAIRAGR